MGCTRDGGWQSTGLVRYNDMKTPDGRQCAPDPVYHGGTLRFPRLETVGGDFQIVSRHQALPMELDFTALRSVGGNFDPHNYLSMTKTFANLTTVGGHAVLGHRPCLVPRELAGYECPSSYGDMGADPSSYTALEKDRHFSEYTHRTAGARAESSTTSSTTTRSSRGTSSYLTSEPPWGTA